LKGDSRPLNYYDIGDLIQWTNCRHTFKGKVMAKIAMSQRMPADFLETLKEKGYIVPEYSKAVSPHFHRLIVADRRKRIYFVIVGKASKVKA
jgi:hypothetical protein